MLIFEISVLFYSMHFVRMLMYSWRGLQVRLTGCLSKIWPFSRSDLAAQLYISRNIDNILNPVRWKTWIYFLHSETAIQYYVYYEEAVGRMVEVVFSVFALFIIDEHFHTTAVYSAPTVHFTVLEPWFPLMDISELQKVVDNRILRL